MTTFWIIYFSIGLAVLLYALHVIEFVRGTAWWRKILALIFAVVLWPVLVAIIVIEGR